MHFWVGGTLGSPYYVVAVLIDVSPTEKLELLCDNYLYSTTQIIKVEYYSDSKVLFLIT